ncbi:tetratricopeptide repeat protein 28-like [Carassius auratus]|uniref:Tetratricopeptide repeat protein 28-like n=1 Tax=Carassius auratus TaxID=7957 RepID=A0A6P6PMK0_CARAU|nr:tetratricopeptide repeat protein 28-like [Carassius auratus]
MEKQGTRREKFGLFGARALGRAVHAATDGPGLSKAEFMEKVRQSNEACQLGDFQTAVKLYGEALRADPQNCILYSNRSAARLKLGQYQTALDDAVKARLLNPKWPKVSVWAGLRIFYSWLQVKTSLVPCSSSSCALYSIFLRSEKQIIAVFRLFFCSFSIHCRCNKRRA